MSVHAQPVPRTLHARGSSRWRHILTPAASGAWNMAVDDVLLARARATGETVLRIYTWANPTLSLGRNQTAAGLYDLDHAQARGIEIVRRPTGGRAVLHHREITYSVTAPTGITSLRESYEGINGLLIGALGRLGVHVDIADAQVPSPLPDDSPCFEVPTAGELTVNGRKLVGSAQWREDGALLQHGSILVDDDQQMIADLSLRDIPRAPAAATLRQCLGRAPSADELLGACVGAIHERQDRDATILAFDQSLLDAIVERERHYRSPQWTWRR